VGGKGHSDSIIYTLKLIIDIHESVIYNFNRNKSCVVSTILHHSQASEATPYASLSLQPFYINIVN